MLHFNIQKLKEWRKIVADFSILLFHPNPTISTNIFFTGTVPCWSDREGSWVFSRRRSPPKPLAAMRRCKLENTSTRNSSTLKRRDMPVETKKELNAFVGFFLSPEIGMVLCVERYLHATEVAVVKSSGLISSIKVCQLCYQLTWTTPHRINCVILSEVWRHGQYLRVGLVVGFVDLKLTKGTFGFPVHDNMCWNVTRRRIYLTCEARNRRKPKNAPEMGKATDPVEDMMAVVSRSDGLWSEHTLFLDNLPVSFMNASRLSKKLFKEESFFAYFFWSTTSHSILCLGFPFFFFFFLLIFIC